MARKRSALAVSSARDHLPREVAGNQLALSKKNLRIKAGKRRTSMLPEQEQKSSYINNHVQSGVGLARLCAAVVAGMGGFIALGLLGSKIWDFKELAHQTDFKIFVGLLLARGIGSMTIGYLIYTLFGTAERLLLPKALLIGKPDHVPTIRSILGVRSPLQAVSSASRNALRSADKSSSKTETHPAEQK